MATPDDLDRWDYRVTFTPQKVDRVIEPEGKPATWRDYEEGDVVVLRGFGCDGCFARVLEIDPNDGSVKFHLISEEEADLG